MKKVVLIIIDGLGDKPIPGLGNKTPLEAARTPSLDWLAENGTCGLMKPVYISAIPTSEEGHFSLFGYSPKIYRIKRGIFTTLGIGMKVKKGDVALRGNFGTVNKKLEVIDRRAGRITDTQSLVKAINGITIKGVRFIVKAGQEHRVGIILRGKKLDSNISDGDPHYSKLKKGLEKVIPLKKTKEAVFTAEVLNQFLEKSHQVLENHYFNKKRIKKGFFPANYIFTRGASSLIKVPSFKKKYGIRAACIAGKALYKGIAKFLGMDLISVKGANGLPSTNLKGKIKAAKNSLKKYNFIFLHIKATDSLAEDGDYLGKKTFIEKIDKNLKPILSLKNTIIIVTADHSTCSGLKRHCREPIPLLIYGKDMDSVKRFSEKTCKKGKIGQINQTDLMKTVFN